MTRNLVYHSITNREYTAAIHGHTVVITGVTARKARDGKIDLSGEFRFTRTWKKKEGNWVLISQALVPFKEKAD